MATLNQPAPDDLLQETPQNQTNHADAIPIAEAGSASALMGNWTTEQQSHLVQALFNNLFHPVLIFGPSGAGKTLILCALINYLRSNPHGLRTRVTVYELPISNHPAGADMMTRARYLFRETSDRATTRMPQLSPIAEPPFFLPLVIEFLGSPLPPLRLALMEGSGEHLKAGVGPDATPYGRLNPLVRKIVQNFSAAISVMYVLPPGQTLDDMKHGRGATITQEEQQMFDLSLRQVMVDEYAQLRTQDLQHYDQHMVLLSQWDRHVSWQKVRFLWLKKRAVLNNYVLKYPNVFGGFNGLHSKSRTWMPFASVIDGGDGHILSTDLSRKRLGMFANRLYAWLSQGYMSAFKSEYLAQMQINLPQSQWVTALNAMNAYFPQNISQQQKVREAARKQAKELREEGQKQKRRELETAEQAVVEAQKKVDEMHARQHKETSKVSTNKVVGKVQAYVKAVGGILWAIKLIWISLLELNLR